MGSFSLFLSPSFAPSLLSLPSLLPPFSLSLFRVFLCVSACRFYVTSLLFLDHGATSASVNKTRFTGFQTSRRLSLTFIPPEEGPLSGRKFEDNKKNFSVNFVPSIFSCRNNGSQLKPNPNKQ